jgi:hypothetical protein
MAPKNALDTVTNSVTYRQLARALAKNPAVAKNVRDAVTQLLDGRVSFGLPSEENVEAIRALRALADLDAGCDPADIQEKCTEAVSLFEQSSILSLNRVHVLDMIEAVRDYPYEDPRASKARDFLRKANTKSMDEVVFLMSLDFALHHLQGLHCVPEDVIPCDQIEGWIEQHVADADTKFALNLLRYLKIAQKALGAGESGASSKKNGGKREQPVRTGGFIMDPNDGDDY